VGRRRAYLQIALLSLTQLILGSEKPKMQRLRRRHEWWVQGQEVEPEESLEPGYADL
jgi:hypothetical protein